MFVGSADAGIFFSLEACDEEDAPGQYFEILELSRVKVIVVPSEGGKSAAKHVLDNLLKNDEGDYDERWLVLDVDRYNVYQLWESITRNLDSWHLLLNY